MYILQSRGTRLPGKALVSGAAGAVLDMKAEHLFAGLCNDVSRASNAHDVF